jgi:hypothetical protein
MIINHLCNWAAKFRGLKHGFGNFCTAAEVVYKTGTNSTALRFGGQRETIPDSSSPR